MTNSVRGWERAAQDSLRRAQIRRGKKIPRWEFWAALVLWAAALAVTGVAAAVIVLH